MRAIKRGLIGLFSIVFLLGVLPLESEAGKWKKYFDNHVSNKDLRGDHEQLEYDNRKTHEWLEKIEGMLGGGSTCPSADDAFTDASGRYVTYPSTDPVEVCDMRTGVFYEQSPDWVNTYNLDPGTAQAHCAALGAGWRVPEIGELHDVVDYTTFNPAVNTSVFSNVQSSRYWSATTKVNQNYSAWHVNFTDGLVSFTVKQGNVVFVWCVRSGN